MKLEIDVQRLSPKIPKYVPGQPECKLDFYLWRGDWVNNVWLNFVITTFNLPSGDEHTSLDLIDNATLEEKFTVSNE